MPEKEVFRRAVLTARPELTGKLRLNKSDGVGYSVSAKLPEGWMTYYWVNFDESLESAVHSFFVHVDDAEEQQKCLIEEERGLTLAPSLTAMRL